MGNLLYVVIVAVVVLAVVAFWWLGKKKADDETEELPEAPPQKLPQQTKKPTETKPVEAKQVEAKPAKPAETKPTEGKADPKPAKAAETKPAEKKRADEPTPERKAEPKAEPKAESAKAPDQAQAKPSDESKPPPPRGTQAPLPKRQRDVDGLRKGLAKARDREGFFGKLKALFAGRKEIDPQILEQMEEVLLTSDVGVKTTATLVEAIKQRLDKGELKDEAKVWEALRDEAQKILDIGGGAIALSAKPTVVMVVGVNGVGKTTTIGKLATRLTQQNKKVVLAAGDTFRAAAVQQLVVWGKRAGCEVVTGAEGSNSGAVIFDAVQKAREIGADVVLADTAGRLHTKTNLMDELKKVAKTLGKAADGAPHETLLVLDATNGQNATQQTALFKEALPLSGIVLTKLDGTAKGGVILGICAEHNVPVRYIGIGERAEDLRDFDAEEFVQALLGQNTETADKAA
ncbi:MAG: signal recognition particle-docking protein FtsY [Polyangiaceae bacterium]